MVRVFEDLGDRVLQTVLKIGNERDPPGLGQGGFELLEKPEPVLFGLRVDDGECHWEYAVLGVGGRCYKHDSLVLRVEDGVVEEKERPGALFEPGDRSVERYEETVEARVFFRSEHGDASGVCLLDLLAEQRELTIGFFVRALELLSSNLFGPPRLRVVQLNAVLSLYILGDVFGFVVREGLQLLFQDGSHPSSRRAVSGLDDGPLARVPRVHFLDADQLSRRQPRGGDAPRAALGFALDGDSVAVVFLVLVSETVSHRVLVQCVTELDEAVETLVDACDDVLPLLYRSVVFLIDQNEVAR